MTDGSVTRWIQDLKTGDEEAARQLWQRYFQQLVRLAQTRLGGSPSRIADEEDVALSVFRCLCDGAERGQFADLTDRNELWRLLVTITAHKVVDQRRYDHQQKRGGGEVRGESALDAVDGSARGLDAIIGQTPTPDFLVSLAEQHQRLLALLKDEILQRTALGKMEGKTNSEIAERIGITRRSVERKLQQIRLIWAEELQV